MNRQVLGVVIDLHNFGRQRRLFAAAKIANDVAWNVVCVNLTQDDSSLPQSVSQFKGDHFVIC